jgi:hypothetical protein
MTTDFSSKNSKKKKKTTAIRGSGLKNFFLFRSRVAIDIG